MAGAVWSASSSAERIDPSVGEEAAAGTLEMTRRLVPCVASLHCFSGAEEAVLRIVRSRRWLTNVTNLKLQSALTLARCCARQGQRVSAVLALKRCALGGWRAANPTLDRRHEELVGSIELGVRTREGQRARRLVTSGARVHT